MTTTAGASTTVQGGQGQLFDFVFQTIAAIPSFHGETALLEGFIRQMDAAQAVAAEMQVSANVKTCLGIQFLNRMSHDVLREARIHMSMTWAEARQLLRDKYGGLQRPLTRQVWRMLSIRKDRRESVGDFAHRLNEEVRLLKRRIEEGGYPGAEAEWRSRIYEELAVETLRRQVPENMRGLIRSTTIQTVKEAGRILEDEECIEREYRGSAEGMGSAERPSGQWIEVRPTRYPRHGSRGQAGPRGPERREPRGRRWGDQDWRRDGANKRMGGRDQRGREQPVRSLKRRKCWECGEESHLARDCPYMFRREREEYRPAKVSRVEPMEINAQKRRGSRRTSGSEPEDSSDSEGSQGSQWSRGPRRGSLGNEKIQQERGQKEESPQPLRTYATVASQ